MTIRANLKKAYAREYLAILLADRRLRRLVKRLSRREVQEADLAVYEMLMDHTRGQGKK